MWNQKGAAKACAGMLLATLKILIMMTQAAKHFSFLVQCFVAWEKCFAAWVIIIKIFNVINIIPWPPPFDFTFLAATFLQLGWDFTSFLEINPCSYKHSSAYKNICDWILENCSNSHIYKSNCKYSIHYISRTNLAASMQLSINVQLFKVFQFINYSMDS